MEGEGVGEMRSGVREGSGVKGEWSGVVRMKSDEAEEVDGGLVMPEVVVPAGVIVYDVGGAGKAWRASRAAA